MYEQADKPKENKSRAVANYVTQKKSGGQQGFVIVDNRPEAIAQRKQQEMANNSPQAMQLKAIRDMVNGSPQEKQVSQLQSMADNNSAEQIPSQKKENNTGLPDNLKSGIENLSGYSIDDVSVHYNSDKPAQLNAHAYAQGTGIHIASGQEKHLPHEAWHVVQQKQGRVKPTIQMYEKVNINDDVGLEKEADLMGSKASSYSQKVNKQVLTEVPLQYERVSRNIQRSINKRNESGFSTKSIERKSQNLIQKNSVETVSVIQRVITLTKETIKGTPEEIFDIIKGSRDGQKAIEKWGEEGLLKWLRDHDNREYASRNAIQSEIKKAVNSDWDPKALGEETKTSFVNIARERIGPCIDFILSDSRPADEIYYKIHLVSKLEGSDSYLEHFVDRIQRIAIAIQNHQPVDAPGIRKTLSLLTSTWPKRPAEYLAGGEDHESLVGKNQDGIPLSIKGLNSELDSILNVSPKELAEGEVVFSGSTYTDPKQREMTKDVDVSYIDNNEVLHLIENGKDMNTLKNKVVGKHDQKTIYDHLTKKSDELEHKAVGPLGDLQAQRTSISDVMWWYSVPQETLNLDVSNQDIRSILRSLVTVGAGIRSGDKRYGVEDLKRILSSKQ